MTTIEGIPENERQWDIKLRDASRKMDGNESVEIIVSRQDGPGRKRVDAAVPPSRDAVIAWLSSQPEVSEQAAETQFKIAEGSMIEYVEGTCKRREVAGYVPCGASRADRWLIPRDGGDEPTEPPRPDTSSDEGDSGDDAGDDDGEAARRVPDGAGSVGGGSNGSSAAVVGKSEVAAADPGGDPFDAGDDDDDDGEQEGWRRYVDPGAEHPVTAERVTETMNAIQQYFREQLGAIQKDGARKRWGLSEEMINQAGVGFCPDRDGIVAELKEQGITEQQMLATGMFKSSILEHALNHCDRRECEHDVPQDLELLAAGIHDGEVSRSDVDIGAVMNRIEEFNGGLNVYQWWSNRVTFPYFDADGDVRYFAARRTGGTDDLPEGRAKYVKHSTNKEYTHPTVDEPLFGAARLPDDPDEVVVTEGLTDVLAARQAGYAAFGPATTQPSREQRAACAEHVEDADQVYVVMDNDDPEEGDDIDISPGLNGALRTAAILRAAGVEADVGVLPRVDGEETDMADYLKHADADDPLREVLADARPPREFDAFDAERHGVAGDSGDDAGDETVAAPRDGSAVGGDAVESDGSRSALFGLSIQDVAGPGAPSKPGERGPNPFLGELNSTGRHFEVIDEETAYDYHASVKAGYTALTWLLCDAGVRDPTSPTGELSDAELFEAWRHAKEQGVIPEDDRIPWRARLHVIREHDLFPPACLPDGYDPDAIPPSVWEDVVEVVDEEYGVSAGLDWV